MNELPEPIREKFDCSAKAGAYRIACRGCNEKWSHPVKPMAVGTILHLLNHAASHENRQ